MKALVRHTIIALSLDIAFYCMGIDPGWAMLTLFYPLSQRVDGINTVVQNDNYECKAT